MEQQQGLVNKFNVLSKAERQLHEAVKQHDFDTITDVMTFADFDALDSDGYSPLWWACILDNTETVRLLIMGGADINAVGCCDENGVQRRIVYDFVTHGNVRGLSIAVSFHANVNDMELLVEAMKSTENLALVKILLAGGLKLHDDDPMPMLLAIRSGNEGLVKIMIEHNVNTKLRDYAAIARSLDLFSIASIIDEANHVTQLCATEMSITQQPESFTMHDATPPTITASTSQEMMSQHMTTLPRHSLRTKIRHRQERTLVRVAVRAAMLTLRKMRQRAKHPTPGRMKTYQPHNI